MKSRTLMSLAYTVSIHFLFWVRVTHKGISSSILKDEDNAFQELIQEQNSSSHLSSHQVLQIILPTTTVYALGSGVLSTQCAAVTIQSGLIRDPPHEW